MRALLLSTIACAVLPLIAQADERPIKFTEITAGMLFGGLDVGPVDGLSGGGYLDVGRRWDNWSIRGEADLFSLGEDPQTGAADKTKPGARRGYGGRLGAGVRRYLQFTDGETPFVTSGWLEAGVGFERLRLSWVDRTWDRRDVYVGVGMEWGGRRLSRKVKSLGMFYALRITIAETPPADVLGVAAAAPPMTCAGPCDGALRAQPYDFGIYLNWGINVGL